MVAWSLQGSNFRGECALVREEPAGGARDPGTRRGPRPPPGAAAWHRPTLLHPCKQTQDAERSNFSAGAAAAGGRGGGPQAQRAAGVPPGGLGRPRPTAKARARGLKRDPRSGARGPQGRSPKDGGRPERAAAWQGGRQAPRLRPRGPRPGRAPAGRARTPARPGLAPPRPLNPGPFIGQPHPCQRDGDRVPRGQDQPGGARQENKKLREELT